MNVSLGDIAGGKKAADGMYVCMYTCTHTKFRACIQTTNTHMCTETRQEHIHKHIHTHAKRHTHKQAFKKQAHEVAAAVAADSESKMFEHQLQLWVQRNVRLL